MSKLRKKYEEERSLPCSVLACHVFMPTWEYVEWLESRVREIDGINLCEGCGKEIDEDDKYHLWEDGIVTCEECGGPESEAGDEQDL